MAEVLKVAASNKPLVVSFMDGAGSIAIDQVADGFGMSKGQLAETAGLARETLYRTARSSISCASVACSSVETRA